ncbi:MAG: fimbrillin family protein [Parabacteroides sp.]|nr:fimbrillin family protein [Parabacteroides sp.]
MKTRYIMIAAMATLLTACSDDENKMDGPVEARVTASMGVETRVVNDDKGEFTWEENDPIGVMVIKVEQPEGGVLPVIWLAVTRM